MKCVICRHGETGPGVATETLQRGGLVLVFRGVPAEICENCGETYVDEETTRRLLAEAEKAESEGHIIGVRDYHAA